MNIKLRTAFKRDIPTLGKHHRKMFEEIFKIRNEKLDSNVRKKLESVYIQKLKKDLKDGTSRAWVVINGDKIIASGAITIFRYVPNPKDLNLNIAYLHSIYTEKAHRRNNYANMIVKEAISYCKNNDIHRMILNASDAGRPVYEKLGFIQTPNAMNLLIE